MTVSDVWDLAALVATAGVCVTPDRPPLLALVQLAQTLATAFLPHDCTFAQWYAVWLGNMPLEGVTAYVTYNTRWMPVSVLSMAHFVLKFSLQRDVDFDWQFSAADWRFITARYANFAIIAVTLWLAYAPFIGNPDEEIQDETVSA